jgi:putative endopeptidase
MKSFLLAGLLGASTLAGIVHAQSAPAPAAASGKPELGTYGFDIAGMNTAIAPGDDFYEYANGTWAKTTAIPADKSSFGAFDVLADRSRDRTRGILEAAAKTSGSKIGTAYATYLDTAGIEKKGLAPIKPWLAEINAVTKANYPTLIAKAARQGVGTPFGTGVGQDAKSPEVYIVGVRQAGLGLPDRDY